MLSKKRAGRDPGERPALLGGTSVLARAAQAQVGERLLELARKRLLWTCRMIDLEVICSTRSREVEEVFRERRSLPEVPITPEVMNRAAQVAVLLAKAGHHRGAKVADLVIAAAAEIAGLALLHYDDDYQRINEVTGQPVEWIAPAGSLDS